MDLNLIWTLAAFLLTLLVFSYLLGDNFLFRLASYIFIGVAAGYLVTVVFYYVLVPRLLVPLVQGSMSERILAAVPGLLGLLLLAKLSPRLSVLGNLSMALVVGVGAAVAVGGAVLGTLFNQVNTVIALFDLSGGAVSSSRVVQAGSAALVLLGTVSSLAYFQFGARSGRPGQPPRRSALVEGLAWIGKLFIAVTLGALFAGVFLASLSALVERLQFLISTIRGLL